MKKVLIITYYWAPSGGAGVQRWLKFIKYLREFGWEPVVYTPLNPEIPEIDEALLKDIPENLEVLRTKIIEPYNIYKLLTFSRKKRINVGFISDKKKPGLMEKISVWIRSNFFIPDARCLWIKPSVKYLKEYLKENKVDVIVSTGPPHSMHIIGMRLKETYNIRWVADFRDPWTNIDFYKELKLSKKADKKHHRLEREVLEKADRVITVGKVMAEEFNQIYERHYDVISNGYDEADTIKGDGVLNAFNISHIGSMPASRNPEKLWKIIKELANEDVEFGKELKIELIGNVDVSVKESIKRQGLDKYCHLKGYVPHNEAIRLQKESAILLLIINRTENAKGILTGKLFEYIASGRPVLCVGPLNGEIKDILEETGAGIVLDYEDEKGMKEALKRYFAMYKNGNLNSYGTKISKYSRRELTGKLAEILFGAGRE